MSRTESKRRDRARGGLLIAPDLSLPLDTVTETLVVYGGKGMGKTNLGAVLAEELSRAGRRFSLLDPVGVSWGLRHAADGQGAGIKLLILGGVHGDLPIEPTAGAVVADLVADEEEDVLVDISRRADGRMWSQGDRIRFVTDYATRLFERQGERRRPIMQIIDEAGRFCPQNPPKGAVDIALCIGAIEQLVELGRNVGVGVTLITQRSARMNKSVSELAECMIAFRTVGPRSIGAILDWLGEHVDKARWKELVEQLRSLPRGRALVVSPGWLEFEGVVQVRLRTTFDSSATPTAAEQRMARRAVKKPADLEKYRERMAETIERAKADDPQALRRLLTARDDEIRRLQTALDRSSGSPGAKQEPHVNAPTLTDGDRAQLDLVRRRIEEGASELGTTHTTLVKEVVSGVEAAVKTALGEFATNLTSAAERQQSKFLGVLDRAGVRRVFDKVAALEAPRRPATAPKGSDGARPTNARTNVRQPTSSLPDTGERLPAGERLVLTAIAQHRDGVTREQLSVLTAYKRSSRDAYIQRLASRGYVDTDGSHLSATSAGVAALGSDFEPLPTGAVLREHWLGRLPEGERSVLQIALNAYPRTVRRDDIDAETGYKRSSRDAYIQRLCARRLVATVGRGEVRASADLFDEKR